MLRARDAILRIPLRIASGILMLALSAHGGSLVNLLASPSRAAAIASQSRAWPSLDLSRPQLAVLELMSNGALSPLRGYMTRREYESVRTRGRLPDGTVWTVPILLRVPADIAQQLSPDSTLALRDAEGVMLATVRVEDLWTPADQDGAMFACVGGAVEAIQLPHHYDFRHLRLTPGGVREEFERRGWSRILAVHTADPMSRDGQQLTQRMMLETRTRLLIQALTDARELGDRDHFARIRSHRAVVHAYPEDTAMLSLLPRFEKPQGAPNGNRGALTKSNGGWDSVITSAIIARNFGCTHLLAGTIDDNRPHLISGLAVDAQQMRDLVETEVGVTLVTAPATLSGSAIRPMRAARPAPATRRPHGLTIFFTGLSGSGKSTICNILMVKLLERTDRVITLLDGDVVRKHLSSELGFSKEHREINIRRIGFVASEITKHGGIAMCAPIAPYAETRGEVRRMVESFGAFLLVHIATPLEVCEARDRKGLYAKARMGLVRNFTGISDPYEKPEDADITIDTTSISAEDAAERILDTIVARGYVCVDTADAGQVSDAAAFCD